MRTNRMTISMTVAAIALLAGCAADAHKGAVADSMHASESAYLGRWRMPSGDLLTVKDAPGDAFAIEHAAPGGNKDYQAYAIDVAGKKMWEVAVNTPAEGGKIIRVYDYWLVALNGDTLTATPIKSEWLEKTVKEMNAGSYKSTGDLVPGTGGAIVKDAGAMEAILKKAVNDPNAFGQSETLTRVKSK